jgi:hypothetical protein
MNAYGKLEFLEPEEGGRSHWQITAAPHVMIRLKSVFPRVNKRQVGRVNLLLTPETCRDLEWFVARYPLKVEPKAEQAMRHGSAHYQRTLQELEALMLPDAPRSEFMMALPARAYQAQAVEIYLKKGSLLLADQMGLGKTVCAIASFTDQRTLPALVVCPTHLVKQWQNDFLPRFLPGARVEVVKRGRPDVLRPLKPADIYLCTYHKLAGWAELWKERFFNSLVFDECQDLRHGDSNKYHAARAIREKIPFCLGLSGTPIYNYGGEIFNVMEILSPGALGEASEFDREWCQRWGNKQLLKDSKAFGAMLREQFLMVRRTRADVNMELPAMQKIIQTIPYDEEVLAKIDNHATELAHLILKGEFTQRGQAAREFDLMLRQQTGIAKAPFVAEFVRMLVEDGQKVLLGGWHRAVYEVWQDRFTNPAYGPSLKPVLYTGTESPAQKQKAKDAFVHGDSMVMMMSLRSGSGVDGLQEVCYTGVFGELDWSPGGPRAICLSFEPRRREPRRHDLLHGERRRQ